MSHTHQDILVALAGQPNCGKSSIFQYLTGTHQQVANYPGITVEKKSGRYKYCRDVSQNRDADSLHHDGGNDHSGHYHQADQRIEVVDLPGTYSLSSYTQEERVARDFLLLQNPEALVVVVDASNLKRHLFLVFQLLELQLPTIICMNMLDVAKRRGMEVNLEELSELLGVPVVPTNGATGEGMNLLREQIQKTVAHCSHQLTTWKLDYDPKVEHAIANLENLIMGHPHLLEDFSPRWLAVKFLEQDRDVKRFLKHHTHDDKWENLVENCETVLEEYEKTQGESPHKTIAVRRNVFANQLEQKVVRQDARKRLHRSDYFDAYLCHPVAGLVFLILIMVLTFGFTFFITNNIAWVPDLSGNWYSPVDAVDAFFSGFLPETLTTLFSLEEGTPFQSLLMDGIIAGIGGVLTFVPIIFVMFLMLSILEQCGYIARVAMVMDRFMRIFGLQGQSILPLVLAGGITGGCAVPAVMATRGMKDRRERLLTILVLPMMNCGAKLPVYALLVSAFFAGFWLQSAVVFTSLILLSWFFALMSSRFLSQTFVKGTASPLLLELPPYQVPRLKDILRTAGLQSWWFIKKAGTIILAVNMFLWCFMYYPRPSDPAATDETQLANSYAGRIGHFLEPVTQWAGFDWRDNVALVGGFAAKEVIVSSLGTLYSMDADDEELEIRLGERLAAEPDWNPVKAYAMMIFVMLYAPCGATCVIILRETQSWRWVALAVIYSTLLAFVMAILIFQVGSFFLV